LLDKKERPDRAPGDHTVARRVRDGDQNTIRQVADVLGRGIRAWNIDDSEEPAFGQSIVPDLRIAREIDLGAGHRSHHRREEDIRIDIHHSVGAARCLIETANPSVDENNELRRADCAH
jgi:hypothetical protein